MRFGQWISLTALIISLIILWKIRYVLLLVFAAVTLATVLNRIVRVLKQIGIRRGLAIAITIFLLFLLLVGFFAIIVPQLVQQVEQLLEVLPLAFYQLDRAYDWIQTRIPGRMFTDDRSLAVLAQNLQSWAVQFFSNFFFLITNSINLVFQALIFAATTIMLLLNPLQYRQVFILAFPAFYRSRVNEILDECEVSLVGWIKATLIAMGAVGGISYIGLLLLGVPLPLVNGLVAALLEFIPNVGPVLSVVPPALLALLDAPWKAIAVIGLYILIQQLESLVLIPYVMKREVSLLPLFTMLSVVVFSIFFGMLGLLLAVPLLIVVQIWLKEVLVKDILNPWQHKPGSHRQEEPTTAPPPAERTYSTLD